MGKTHATDQDSTLGKEATRCGTLEISMQVKSITGRKLPEVNW